MKHLLTSTFVLLFASASFGQFSIGAAAGGNITFWTLDFQAPLETLKSDPLLNFQAMVPITYAISEHCQIRAELGYHRRSWGFFDLTDGTGEPAGDAYSVSQYLEAGLLATVQPLRKARPIYFLGGLSFSRLTPYSHLYMEKARAQALNIERVIKLSNNFDEERRTQLLWNLGLGITKKIGPGNLFIEWRAQRNISNLLLQTDTARKDFTAIAMNLGYQFRLQRKQATVLPPLQKPQTK